MALDLSYHELLQYTNDEREKWRRWLQLHPEAIDAALQPGSGLATVGKLIDHVFLVERRHLQQLTGDRLSESTGLTGNNAPPLFDYGASVRRELEQLAREIEDEDTGEASPGASPRQAPPMSPRKILFHILIHEIRHWAQIALAVRLAGFTPPGDHDLFSTGSRTS